MLLSFSSGSAADCGAAAPVESSNCGGRAAGAAEPRSGEIPTTTVVGAEWWGETLFTGGSFHVWSTVNCQ